MNKNKQFIIDAISIVLLIVSMVLLINPFDLIMTTSLQMVILGLVSLLVIAILLFQWKERPVDEREEAHLMLAGRVSFFSVSIVLLLALIVQTFNHEIDPWIPTALLVLLVSKVVSLKYLKLTK